MTKEHLPPQSFFPQDQRNQLLTVRSCKAHNNEKSSDDLYVLAQICMNASPSNYSRDVFIEKVAPQLGYNKDALRKMLSEKAVPLENGAVRYKVDLQRLDSFFDALSCGIIFKSCGKSLTLEYQLGHIYHSLENESETTDERKFKQLIVDYYTRDPMGVMEFGDVKAINTKIYSVKIFGISDFRSSITIVHDFFGVFRVTSMLTRTTNIK